MSTIEFFFDCSSPWTYLAFENIQPIAARADARIEWRPILVGGVFNSVNPSVYEARATPVPAKAAWAARDLQEWAQASGIEIGNPPVFPVNSVKVMRGALHAQEQGLLIPWARRVFEAYWRDLEDISDDAVIDRLVADTGLDADAFRQAIGSAAIKARLRANTDELVARGGFGSPTLFVDRDHMYFGNDRLPLLERRLGRGGDG